MLVVPCCLLSAKSNILGSIFCSLIHKSQSTYNRFLDYNFYVRVIKKFFFTEVSVVDKASNVFYGHF